MNYSDASTHDVTYTYDREGRVKTRVDGSGTTTYTWDSLGSLLSVVDTAGGGTISYSYDLAGALASETDGRGTTNYHYDNAHQLIYMIYPQTGGGTAEIAFKNDADGRRTDTWLETNATQSVWAAHSHTVYDLSGRVQEVTSQEGPATSPTTVLDDIYCYAAGSVAPSCDRTTKSVDRSQLQWMKNVVSGETNTYSYNADNRLTKVIVTGGSNPKTFGFSYDNAGNRLTYTISGSTPSSQSLTYNGANRISTSGYTYDGAGNLTGSTYFNTTATWNTASQLTQSVSSGSATNYTYAGTNQNELTKEVTTGGDTYKYAYGRPDSNGLPEIEEVTRVSGGTTYNAYVAHDPSGLPVMLQTSTGTVAMYIYDGAYNPVGLVTNGSSLAYLYYYDPYGTATLAQNSGGAGVPQNPYTFGGGLQDRVTGLIKFGSRWYNPATGSWIQQDTLNAPLDPSNANRYEYAGDNPVNEDDPTGDFQVYFSYNTTVDIAAGLGVGAALANFIPAAGQVISGLLAIDTGAVTAAVFQNPSVCLELQVNTFEDVPVGVVQ